MTEDSNRLRTRYFMALAYLIGQSAGTRDRIVVRQILALEAPRQPWTRAADAQQVSAALQRLGGDAGPWGWAAGTTIAVTKSAQHAARGLKRRVGQQSNKLQ